MSVRGGTSTVSPKRPKLRTLLGVIVRMAGTGIAGCSSQESDTGPRRFCHGCAMQDREAKRQKRRLAGRDGLAWRDGRVRFGQRSKTLVRPVRRSVSEGAGKRTASITVQGARWTWSANLGRARVTVVPRARDKADEWHAASHRKVNGIARRSAEGERPSNPPPGRRRAS